MMSVLVYMYLFNAIWSANLETKFEIEETHLEDCKDIVASMVL